MGVIQNNLLPINFLSYKIFSMKPDPKKYTAIMVKVGTHQKLKQLSLDFKIPITRLVDFLLLEHQYPQTRGKDNGKPNIK